jgi:hypothetical protein
MCWARGVVAGWRLENNWDASERSGKCSWDKWPLGAVTTSCVDERAGIPAGAANDSADRAPGLCLGLARVARCDSGGDGRSAQEVMCGRW